MARQKRIAAPGYKGVFFVDSVSPATGEPDQIIYIRYKKDGKLYEEKVGRSSEKAPKPNQKKYWSPYLASLVRADRMRGKEMTNAERRAEKQAAKEAEAGRWTVTKLWGEYKAARPIKGIKTDEGRFNKFLAPAFGDKEPHEIDQLSVVRLRSKMLKDKAPQTVKNTLELLRRIVNFGVNARLCSPLPFKIEFPKCNNIVTEDLTPEQLQALMAAIENSKHPVAGPMMRQMRQLGMDVRFMGGDGICTVEMAKLAGDAVGEGKVVCAEAGGVTPDKAAALEDFKKRFNSKFNANVQLYAPYVYDAVNLLVAAMQKDDSTDPEKYLPELAKIEYDGITGHIAFDERGDMKKAALTLYTFKGGQKTQMMVVQ